ncbi:neuralized-like protein 4 [Anneissia japonica]|uniref:neuralized-like protein 4 n=1 Tax=Anneissia japonica TaxID=1529436 RepID=UPI001425954B|nr:neuralized-like protein 4 [Anneissia japonica]
MATTRGRSKSKAKFHRRCGSLIILENENRTARRNLPSAEFDNGLVLSSEPLEDDEIFEIIIDKKVHSWSGSIEIGITSCDISNMVLPSSAAELHEGCWILHGCSMLRNGASIRDDYGCDLELCDEGDVIGVQRRGNGELHIYLNQEDQGVAATGIPPYIHAVVDLYGKCAQISTVDRNVTPTSEINPVTIPLPILDNSVDNSSILANTLSQSSTTDNSSLIGLNSTVSLNNNSAVGLDHDLCFHLKHGTLIQLSNGKRTAERMHAMDEFNNGIVMTNRPLRNEEYFEIRLDKLIDKWSGSIEIGITTHNPDNIDFPATMTNLRSGTTMMSGCGILTNGKGTRREYGQFNLDELQEGDIIGVMKKSNGDLHFYINNIDQGLAASCMPEDVYGVVDLYGMAVRVSIISRDANVLGERMDYLDRRLAHLNLLRALAIRQFPNMYNEITDELCNVPLPDYTNEPAENHSVEIMAELGTLSSVPAPPNEPLRFYPRCGAHAKVANGGKTALRPDALGDFNNGVVLSNRHIKSNELFEIRIDKVVDKWAGSIEIGVTTHSPFELDFPTTMTNVRSGTWMMTGTGVMHNGTTIMDNYGYNLDRLKEGDRIGVMRKENGNLNFYINGEDQGMAVPNVPSKVFAVVDLYGQAAQATILDQSDNDAPSAEIDNAVFNKVHSQIDMNSDLQFHRLHGRNVTVMNQGQSAVRPNARGEFNDAVIMSNRPLKDDELFEIKIEDMVDRWSGSIEAGVTVIRPEEMSFPGTMTDLDHDTWMLSGSSVLTNGNTIKNGYSMDLDVLEVNHKVGIMRKADGTLHFFHNGVDQGVACSSVSPNVYAIIDLYGQCSRVSLAHSVTESETANNGASVQIFRRFSAKDDNIGMKHYFHECCGKNIILKNLGSTACRQKGCYDAILFSSKPLKVGETFEVEVEKLDKKWSGCLVIGLTSFVPETPPSHALPNYAVDIKSRATWLLQGSDVKRNGVVVKENYTGSVVRLEVGSTIGVQRQADNSMHIIINGEDAGAAATNIPKEDVYAIIDLCGSVDSVRAVSNEPDVVGIIRAPSISSCSDVSSDKDDESVTSQVYYTEEFHQNHGKNISLSCANMTARRTASYNQGIAISRHMLARQQKFEVKLERLSSRWTSSIQIGVIGQSPEKFIFPVSATSIKKSAWIISGDSLFHNTIKVHDQIGPDLNKLQVGCTVGVLVDEKSCLHLLVNGMDHGVVADDIPHHCHAVVDLYGQCEQVSILGGDLAIGGVSEEREKADFENGLKENCRLLSELNLTPRCEYQEMCRRFKAMLALPRGYFEENPKYNKCYCDSCYKHRGDDAYNSHGEPPKEYSRPLGWCKFALRLPSRVDMQSLFESCHVAFHTTDINTVRKILDSGSLMCKGDSMIGGILSKEMLSSERLKFKDTTIDQILLSPSMKYCISHANTRRMEYHDDVSGKSQYAQVAFQVRVHPDSYDVGPERIGANQQIDAHFDNKEIQWMCKEKSVVVPYALLIKID